MTISYKVIDNFLNETDLKKLEDMIMLDYMPWYFNDFINRKGDEFFQFTYGFVKMSGEPNCSDAMMSILEPFRLKLKVNNFLRVKANLTTKTNKIVEHGMHTDTDESKGKTGIFYLNTCNGYTKLENGEKIISKKNRYLEFDCNTKHSGSSCTDEKRRVVINFNYS